MIKITHRMFCVLLATVMVAACDKVTEKASDKLAEEMIESAIGGDADIDIKRDGEQITVKSDEGEMTISSGESASLPDSFPKDVPLPEGLAIESTMSMPQGMLVSGKLSGKSDDAISQMKKQMQDNGWKETMNMTSDGSNFSTYSKAERVVNYTFETLGDETEVNVIVAKDGA